MSISRVLSDQMGLATILSNTRKRKRRRGIYRSADKRPTKAQRKDGVINEMRVQFEVKQTELKKKKKEEGKGKKKQPGRQKLNETKSA